MEAARQWLVPVSPRPNCHDTLSGTGAEPAGLQAAASHAAVAPQGGCKVGWHTVPHVPFSRRGLPRADCWRCDNPWLCKVSAPAVSPSEGHLWPDGGRVQRASFTSSAPRNGPACCYSTTECSRSAWRHLLHCGTAVRRSRGWGCFGGIMQAADCGTHSGLQLARCNVEELRPPTPGHMAVTCASFVHLAPKRWAPARFEAVRHSPSMRCGGMSYSRWQYRCAVYLVLRTRS